MGKWFLPLGCLNGTSISKHSTPACVRETRNGLYDAASGQRSQFQGRTAIDLGFASSVNASGLQIVGLGVLSLLVSVVAGMTGAAMGIVQLPVMLALGFDPLVSAGTSLGVILLGSIAGIYPHFKAGRVVPRVVVIFGLPTMLGTFGGAVFANLVPTWILLALVSVILAILTVITYQGAWKRAHPPLRPVRHNPIFQRTDPTGTAYLRARTFLVDGSASGAIGALGGAAGMTLGALRLPILVSFLKMNPWYAVGTNAMISLLTAVAGFAGHALHGSFDPVLLLVMGIAAMVGAGAGASLTGRLRPNLLRLVIALILTAMLPLIIYRTVLAF